MLISDRSRIVARVEGCLHCRDLRKHFTLFQLLRSNFRRGHRRSAYAFGSTTFGEPSFNTKINSERRSRPDRTWRRVVVQDKVSLLPPPPPRPSALAPPQLLAHWRPLPCPRLPRLGLDSTATTAAVGCDEAERSAEGSSKGGATVNPVVFSRKETFCGPDDEEEGQGQDGGGGAEQQEEHVPSAAAAALMHQSDANGNQQRVVPAPNNAPNSPHASRARRIGSGAGGGDGEEEEEEAEREQRAKQDGAKPGLLSKLCCCLYIGGGGGGAAAAAAMAAAARRQVDRAAAAAAPGSSTCCRRSPPRWRTSRASCWTSTRRSCTPPSSPPRTPTTSSPW